ncbi:MAG: hypothetical protein HDR56_01695 [Treponema sp.]|nr:hypothetical protein [Treponema sp.]
MKCSYCRQKCYRNRKPMIMLWTGLAVVCEDCFFHVLERKYGGKKEEDENDKGAAS